MSPKQIFRLILLTDLALMAAMAIPRMWAAKHSAPGSSFETLADAMNATV